MPPSQVTRLADLDPAAVGREATDLVLERLGALALVLSPGVSVHVGQPQGDTDLSLTVAALCAWAQRGALGDWQDHEDAADALLSAATSLFSSPARSWSVDDLDGLDEIERGESVSAVRLALACALTRLRVCRGDVVTVDELARLASVSRARLHQLADAGEISAQRGGPREPTRVVAVEARRWLTARGVAGV